MGISIHYTSSRANGLNGAEVRAIEEVVKRYSVKDQIEQYHQTGIGLDGEDFCLYDPPLDSPDVVLEGATRLPDSSEEILWTGAQHWCRALSEIRRLLPNADWHVHIDDHNVQWDEGRQEFDPSK